MTSLRPEAEGDRTLLFKRIHQSMNEPGEHSQGPEIIDNHSIVVSFSSSRSLGLDWRSEQFEESSRSFVLRETESIRSRPLAQSTRSKHQSEKRKNTILNQLDTFPVNSLESRISNRSWPLLNCSYCLSNASILSESLLPKAYYDAKPINI